MRWLMGQGVPGRGIGRFRSGGYRRAPFPAAYIYGIIDAMKDFARHFEPKIYEHGFLKR